MFFDGLSYGFGCIARLIDVEVTLLCMCMCVLPLKSFESGFGDCVKLEDNYLDFDAFPSLLLPRHAEAAHCRPG